MALWKDRLEDDGALHASETTLRRIADAVVAEAIRGLRRAFVEGDVSRQWRAQIVLELARLLRLDLERGTWGRLAAEDRRQLGRAFLTLGALAHSRAPVPLA